jgi:large subunit ribosomal protein L24
MSDSSSRQPRRQRKAHFNLAPHQRHELFTIPLSRELRNRYHRRRLTVRKGDTVRVLAGSFVGREERVAKVDRRRMRIILDNVTLRKADKKLQQLPLNTGHLLLTRLNLTDAWRRRILREPEPVEEEPGTVGAPVPEASAPAEPPKGAATPDDEEEPAGPGEE